VAITSEPHLCKLSAMIGDPGAYPASLIGAYHLVLDWELSLTELHLSLSLSASDFVSGQTNDIGTLGFV
jgi:hypothetical protein